MMSESWILTDILNIFNNTWASKTRDSEKLATVKKIEDEIYLTDGFYLIPVLLLVQGSQSSLQKGSEEIQKLRNNTEISIKLYSFKLVKTELKDHQVHLQLGDWRSTIKYKRGSSTNFEYLNTLPIVQQCIRKFISNNEAPEKAHTANNSENLSLLLNEINQEYTLSFSGKDSSSRDSIISIYSLLPASGMDRDPEKSSNKESSKGKEKQINHREPDENSQCLCLTSKTMSRKKNKFWAIPADQMEVLDAIPEWKSTYEPSPESSITKSQEINLQVSLNGMLSYISSGNKEGFIERNKSS